MPGFGRRIASGIIVIAMALGIMSAAAGYGGPSGGFGGRTDEAIVDAAAYLLRAVPAPGVGQTGGEWAVIALVRSGAAVPGGYILSYYDRVAAQLERTGGQLSTVKYSEYSRVALAIAAIGADPRDVGGYDMIAPLMDYDMAVRQGLNGPIFALIALDGTGFSGEDVTGRYLDFILERQLDDGGFTLSGGVSDPDTTAMALTALSRYTDREGVAQAIGRALERLSLLQRPSGGFTSFSSTNSESVSQAIIALCSLGVPLDDERFIKNDSTLFDNLMTYCVDGQGFEHERGGGASLMATEQALCALAALWRHSSGMAALYDMADSPDSLPDAAEPPPAGGEGPAVVSVPAVTGDAVQFGDIEGHGSEEAIRELAGRGIVNGYPAGRFDPDGGVTRAELAAIFVRALGLAASGDGLPFSDVPPGSWFRDYAQAAFEHGLIQGRTPDAFDPSGFVTRQEAAVMACRASALCGVSEVFDETAVRNVLSQFIDYRTVAAWAAEPLAFCYYSGLLDDSGLEILPMELLTRGEAAEIAFRMLKAAKLV